VQPLAAVRLDASQYQAATQLDASLQAFAAVEQQRPYDEELLTAVLLADAGRAYDRRDPIKAILAAAAGLLTERTVWLITMRDEAHAYAVGTLGKRARQRLVTHPDFDDVSLLASAVDRHRSGCEISDLPAYTLDKAISLLRDLGAESGDSDCL
jgi:DNA-binding XRE family transcriptional regulator